jgi:hypothetical protein
VTFEISPVFVTAESPRLLLLAVIKLGELVMILDLHSQGLSVSAITRQVGVDRKTVRAYVAKGLEPPAYKKRPPAPSLARIVADRGYRGHNAPTDQKMKVYIPGQKRGVADAIKRDLRRRSAVEPVIGHAKGEHRMGRNFLKGAKPADSPRSLSTPLCSPRRSPFRPSPS